MRRGLRAFMLPVVLGSLMSLPGIGGAQPVPKKALFRVSAASTITREESGYVIHDQALAAIVQSRGVGEIFPVWEIWEPDTTLYVLPLGLGQSLQQTVAALDSLACVSYARVNTVFVTDSDPSEPSDFFFTTNYWPYWPWSDPEDVALLHTPFQDWADSCKITGYHNDQAAEYFPDQLQLADQWNLRMMQANLAWLITQGSHDVRVAILDSGVDWRHPDLGENIWNNLVEDADHDGHTLEQVTPGDKYSEWKLDPDDPNDLDEDSDNLADDLVGRRWHLWPSEPPLALNDPDHGECVGGTDPYGDPRSGYQDPHGTQMASLIGAGINEVGCIGVSPVVSMIPINGGKSFEDGTDHEAQEIGEDELVAGISYAIAKNAHVINISLSIGVDDGYEEPQELKTAVFMARSMGIIVCCSAGNTYNDHTRWPAAWDDVVTAAVVRPDSVKTGKSSYGLNVDFVAPSGAEYDPGFKHSEIMAAVKWSPPQPFWPDWTPWHDATTPSGSVHTYKQLNGDTSGGAAQLSGAFALLKAHYPNHSREELIAEMVRGAVNVDALNPEYAGRLGSGLINPYRSLTEWSGPRASELPSIVWSDSVWVSGDYTVPAGASLTIMPGTTVYIANFDNEHLGGDPDKISISANQIFANGTLEAPIRFVPFGPASEGPGAWSLGNSGPSALNVVQLQHCEFIGLKHLAVFGSTDPEADSSFIENCHFTSPASGETGALQLSAAEVRSSIFEPAWSTYCTGNVLFEACRVERPAEAEGTAHGIYWSSGGGGAKCIVQSCIFRNVTVGIRTVATATDSLIIENVLIEHAYDPPEVARGELGIDVQGGVVKASGLTLRGYTAGVSLDGSGRFSAEYSTFTDCYQAALNLSSSDNLMFFGYYQEDPPLITGGYNIFAGNEKNNIVNLHPTGTISARQNWWGSPSGPPAKSNKGRVDAIFPLLVDPNLPPPPDFVALAEGPSPPFNVGRNYPNPFNPVTEFTLTVPRGGGLVRATVYDIRGRAVRRLLDKPLASGEHRIEFNGRNDAGEALPSGMYLCRFNFKDREEVVKATLVK